MQIAVTPNASVWIVVPEFPPPGWERAEARRRTSGMAGADPRRRAKLEELLHSPEVKQYIEQTWSDGSVIPAF